MTIVDKISSIKNICDAKDFSQKNTLIKATIACLEPSERAIIITIGYPFAHKIDLYLLDGIREDISKAGFNEYHAEMINKILANFKEYEYKKKNKYAYLLYQIYDKCPIELQVKILNLYLNSCYKLFRNRAYKILKQSWNAEYSNMIIAAWEKYNDFQCLDLIVKNFQTDFLIIKFKKFYESLDTSSYLSRKLLERVSSVELSYLNEIKITDPISYVYILTKIGHVLAHSEAIELFETNINDARINILIWSFGQMRLQNTLEYVFNHFQRQLSES